MTTRSGRPGRQGQGSMTEDRGLQPSGGSGPWGPGARPRAGDVSPRVGTECYGDVCITCSDTAVEVTVVRLLGDALAVVDTGQGEEEVSVALVEAQPGDTILVHAKEAIAIVGR